MVIGDSTGNLNWKVYETHITRQGNAGPVYKESTSWCFRSFKLHEISRLRNYGNGWVFLYNLNRSGVESVLGVGNKLRQRKVSKKSVSGHFDANSDKYNTELNQMHIKYTRKISTYKEHKGSENSKVHMRKEEKYAHIKDAKEIITS